MRSSSFSQSLIAKKAMRDDPVSKSRTLKAASRAIRQAFSARRVRSSGEPVPLPIEAGFAAGFLPASRGLADCASIPLADSADPGDFRGNEGFPGILMRAIRRHSPIFVKKTVE